MLLASSEEPEAGAELLALTSAAGITVGVTSSATGWKRKIETGPTPPQARGKRAQRRPSLGKTFDQAEDSLLGVMLVEGYPYTVLTRTQITFGAVDTPSKFIPTFEEWFAPQTFPVVVR